MTHFNVVTMICSFVSMHIYNNIVVYMYVTTIGQSYIPSYNVNHKSLELLIQCTCLICTVRHAWLSSNNNIDRSVTARHNDAVRCQR